MDEDSVQMCFQALVKFLFISLLAKCFGFDSVKQEIPPLLQC
jgi:hypothetical protein